MQLPISSDKDQNFDGLVEHFENKIYGSMKGQLRLKLIKQDLLQQYPQLTTDKLRILDVAGGLGQIATWLAAMGHEVVIADISLQMIERSKQLAELTKVEHPILWLHSPLQDLQQVLEAHHLQQPFDLIIAHAILEWMDQPKQGFDAIVIDNRALMGAMLYYQQGSPVEIVAIDPNNNADNHYEIFKAFDPDRHRRVLFVTTRSDDAHINYRFATIKPLGQQTVALGGNTARTYHLFDISDYYGSR